MGAFIIYQRYVCCRAWGGSECRRVTTPPTHPNSDPTATTHLRNPSARIINASSFSPLFVITSSPTRKSRLPLTISQPLFHHHNLHHTNHPKNVLQRRYRAHRRLRLHRLGLTDVWCAEDGEELGMSLLLPAPFPIPGSFRTYCTDRE